MQYASQAYTNLLKAHGIRISMSRTGNPYDNAQAESFIKTLKYEEVYLFEYQNLTDARGRIGRCPPHTQTRGGANPKFLRGGV